MITKYYTMLINLKYSKKNINAWKIINSLVALKKLIYIIRIYFIINK